MSPKKQLELAEVLNAKKIVFDQGHMGDEEVKKQIYCSIIEHINNVI